MNLLKKVELAIIRAFQNNQNCPICNAQIVLVDADAVQGEIYAHDCECLYEASFYQMNTYGVNPSLYGIEDYYPIEGDRSYCVYEDDEICIFEDGQLIQKTFYPPSNIKQKKTYTNYCHQCKSSDGVDSDDEKCIEDPPYGYSCKHCQHSLRTHKKYGEGRVFDMAKKGITWRFVGKKPTLIEVQKKSMDDDIPF
jgi:hypothetical protein